MAEDFNKLRLTVKRLMKAKFKQSWQFRLEFDDQPENFDIYVKDISYGPTELENEPVKIGGRTLTYPTGAAPVNLSMTVREDSEKEIIAQWFDEWAGKVVNKDGTMNLPYGSDGYVRKVRRYCVNEDGSETLRGFWEVFPVQRGDVSESREEGGFLEFPITFVQFRS